LAKKILMGEKELARMSAMEKVKEGTMALTEAATGLRISGRQTKRTGKIYRKKGAFGLVRGNRGRASNNRTAEKTKTLALAAEKLKENGGIAVSGEETAATAMALLSCRIKKYGIPRALYRGRKNACVANREPAAEEQLAGE
jgi:hypothetical protein